MNWSQLTALTSLSCALSHEQVHFPPRVLRSMTSLERIDISLDDPEIHPDLVDEEYGGDEEVAYRVEVIQKVFMRTHGLKRLTSLLIDGDEYLEQAAAV